MAEKAFRKSVIAFKTSAFRFVSITYTPVYRDHASAQHKTLVFSQPRWVLGKNMSITIIPGFLMKNRFLRSGGLLRPKFSWYVSSDFRILVMLALEIFAHLLYSFDAIGLIVLGSRGSKYSRFTACRLSKENPSGSGLVPSSTQIRRPLLRS